MLYEVITDIVMSYMSRASRFVPAAGRSGRYVTIGRLGGYYDLKYYRHLDRNNFV